MVVRTENIERPKTECHIFLETETLLFLFVVFFFLDFYCCCLFVCLFICLFVCFVLFFRVTSFYALGLSRFCSAIF